YGTLTNGNTSATAGVQKDGTTFTQYFCNGSGGAATGGQSYIQVPCPSPTPTPTPTGTPSCTPSLTMYGSNGNGTLNRGALVTINQTNGTGTLVGTPVAGTGLSGLAFHPDGRLFASTVTSGSPSSLIQVNPDTGALIATIGTINENGTPLSIGDLSFQPGTNVLYG